MAKSKHPEYTLARKEDLDTWRVWYRMHQIVLSEEYAYVESSVCEEWHGSAGYLNFVEDMGHKKPGHILSRKNKFGDWDKDNCEWVATKKQNQANRRCENKDIHKYRDIALQNGIKGNTYWARLRAGWSPKDAGTEKPHYGKPLHKRTT